MAAAKLRSFLPRRISQLLKSPTLRIRTISIPHRSECTLFKRNQFSSEENFFPSFGRHLGIRLRAASYRARRRYRDGLSIIPSRSCGISCSILIHLLRRTLETYSLKSHILPLRHRVVNAQIPLTTCIITWSFLQFAIGAFYAQVTFEERPHLQTSKTISTIASAGR